MWAQITGDTLYTYGMLINDDGASDLQVYERTRTEDGLELRFYRFADGWLKKATTGTLKEVKR